MQPGRVVHHNKEPFDVYIGRPGPWGNPYSHKADSVADHLLATRAEAISAYRDHLLSSPQLLGQLDDIAGLTLGCWCKPSACHGDILADLAVLPRILLVGCDHYTHEPSIEARLSAQTRAIIIAVAGTSPADLALDAAGRAGHEPAPMPDLQSALRCRPHITVAFTTSEQPSGELRGQLEAAWKAGSDLELLGAGLTARQAAHPGRTA